MKEMKIRLEKTRLESGISESYLALAQKTERDRDRERERERERESQQLSSSGSIRSAMF